MEEFVSRLIEQSLDEIRFKNFAITTPLTTTRIDNICRSLLGSKYSLIDCGIGSTVSDLCVQLTNLENDSVAVLKNIDTADSMKWNYIKHFLAERKLTLQSGDDEFAEIPLSECPVVLFLQTRGDLGEEYRRYFNCVFDISSSELPSPHEEIGSDQIESEFDRDDDGQSDVSNITSTLIAEWKYAEREPDIDEDVDLISGFITEVEDVASSECWEDGMLSICYEYLRYVEHSYSQDVVHSAEEALCRKSGIYHELLLADYNHQREEMNDAPCTLIEYQQDGDERVDFRQLIHAVEMFGSRGSRKQLLHRLLSAINADLESGTRSDKVELSDRVHEINDVSLIEEFMRACRNLKRGKYHHVTPELVFSDHLRGVPVVEPRVGSKKFALRLKIADCDWNDIQTLYLECQVPNSDGDTIYHLDHWVETHDCKSLCYLVYEAICIQEHERSGRNCTYFDKFQTIMNKIHSDLGLSEYKIAVEGIDVGRRSFDGVDADVYEWWNYFEAYSRGSQEVEISNGYGDYEAALKQVESVSEE